MHNALLSPSLRVLPSQPALCAASPCGRTLRRAAGVAVLSLLLPLAAQAQSGVRYYNSMDSNKPDYFGLSAGSADLTRPISGLGVFGGSNQSAAYRAYMGHFFPQQNYGVEFGYTDFGSINRSGGSTKVDGFDLHLVGRLPLNDSFNLLGKIGTTYARTRVDTSAASRDPSGTERDFGWSYGLGGELLINPDWSVVLEYSEHYVKYPTDSSERVSATLVGLRYRY